jgi:hypothetical protein
MAKDLMRVLKTEGANQIKEYCCIIAKDLGLELTDQPYWSFDSIKQNGILNIEAGTRAGAKASKTQILFSPEEIEAILKGVVPKQQMKKSSPVCSISTYNFKSLKKGSPANPWLKHLPFHSHLLKSP